MKKKCPASVDPLAHAGKKSGGVQIKQSLSVLCAGCSWCPRTENFRPHFHAAAVNSLCLILRTPSSPGGAIFSSYNSRRALKKGNCTRCSTWMPANIDPLCVLWFSQICSRWVSTSRDRAGLKQSWCAALGSSNDSYSVGLNVSAHNA